MEPSVAAPTPPTPNWQALIEKLLAEAPKDHNGALECQVILMNGATLSGALFHNTYGEPGFYCLRSIMRKDNAASGPPAMVDSFFAANAIFTFMMATPQAAQPRIITPNGPRMS